ncbi:hypothetical protein J7E62_32925 [Variovorax paradoxus]|nr:hypothetical protein [Variovorax paradoxus]
MATTPTKSPRKRPSNADAAKLVAHWNVVVDNKKNVKQRIAALTAVGWNLTADKQHLRAALGILKDPEEAIELRLAVLALLQSMTFDPKRFETFRADYLRTLRTVSSDSDPELRQRALGVLAREHDPATQEKLLAGLKDPTQALVAPEKALQLLSYDVHTDAYPLARAIVKKPPNGTARREALRLLAADGSSASMFETILMDKTESSEIRQLSASALHSLAPERLQACAREITLDSSEPNEIRSVGVTALTHFADSAKVRQDDVLNNYLKQLGEDATSDDSSLKTAARQYVAKRLA